MNNIIITTALRGLYKHPDGNSIELKIIYKDGDIENLEDDNITYDFLNKPIESITKKGFYYIPFHSRYLINENGDLLDTVRNVFSIYHRTKKTKNNKKNRKHGYYRVRVTKDNNVHTITSRHRLKALAFHNYDTDSDELVINHKDGIPGNDEIDNLEWCTKRENLIHAIQNGLMPNSMVKIEAMDCINNKIYKFNSIADASFFFKITHSKISHRLRKGIIRYPDNIIFKIDDGKPWPLIPEIKKGMGVRIPLVAYNIKENKAYIFDTIMATQRFTSVNTTTISDRIKNNSKKPSNDFIFMTLKEFDLTYK